MGCTNSAERYTEKEGDEPLPPPRPPKKTKRQIVHNEDMFTEIDQVALKTPRSAEMSIDKLCAYLCQSAESDLHKIRAFYRWIAQNIRYDTRSDFHDKNIDTNGEAVLRMRSTVCIGYANLFADLCRKAGIPVKVISGYSKGYNYNPEETITSDKTPEHAWNAVYINGDWQFVECTWGAGSRDERGNFVKRFSDFHFLTEPKHFIVCHFPYMDDDMIKSRPWQLLQKPLTLDLFSKRLKGFSQMYQWRVKPVSHVDGVVVVNKKLEIIMEHKKSSYCFYTVRMYQKQSGKNYDEYTMVQRHGKNRVKITVRPPKTGDFMLHVYGRIDPNVAELVSLTNYVLKCETVDEHLLAYPKHQGIWGQYDDYLEAGFHKTVGEKSQFESKDGNFSLPIKTTESVDAIVKMEHATESLNPNDNYTLLEKRKDNSFLLQAKLPTNGYYKISVFTKNKSLGTYSPRVCYLVLFRGESKKCEPFPKDFPQTTQFSCHLIEPVTGELPAHSNVNFRFSSPGLKQAIVQEQKMSKRGSQWEASIKTPGPGEKVRISASDQDGPTFWRIYEFNVM